MAWTTSHANLVTTLTGGTGDQPGLDLRGRAPGQTLRVMGATPLVAITTGLNSFTAGTGTSATSVAKQTASADWTAGDLEGLYLLRTGGGGYDANAPIDNLRQILSNTTTTLAVNTMPGLDNTSTLQIVELATKVDYISAGDPIALRLQGNLGPIEVIGVDFSTTHTLDGLLEAIDCVDVTLQGCSFISNLANPSVVATRVQKFTFNDCLVAIGADMAISQCVNVSSTGVLNAAGGVVDIQDCNFVDIRKYVAGGGASRAISIKRAFVVTLEAACSTRGASPIYLEDCTFMEAVGGLLTGSGNTGYGVEFAHAGQYVITGSTITGTTSDVLFDTRDCTYALELSNTYGRMATSTMGLICATNPTKTILLGNVLFDGSGDHSSRELYYGIINPAQNVGLVAAGTTVADALQLPAGEHYGIGTVAAGTGVKLHNVSALPGPRVVIDNNGANTLTVYPSAGGTINGGASISVAAGAIVMLVCSDFSTDKWKAL
jgi:hypothetical protein